VQAWGKIVDNAKRVGVSPRLVRRWLKMGLKHSRVPGGCVLIRFEDVDDFLKSYEIRENKIDQLVDEIIKEIK